MAERHCMLRGWWKIAFVFVFVLGLISWSISIYAADLLGLRAGSLQMSAAAPAPAEALPPGSASTGMQLFMGTRSLANGGPACASCHRVAGLPFPNGGTLGPDLTTAYVRFGPAATRIILQTLFFPTMAPIYADRLLTAQEQSDIAAFLQHASTQAAPTGLAIKIILPAVGGFLVLLVLGGSIWRKRIHNVRKALVAQYDGTGDARS